MTEPLTHSLYTPVDPHALADAEPLACMAEEAGESRVAPAPPAPMPPSQGAEALVSGYTKSPPAPAAQCFTPAVKAGATCVGAAAAAYLGAATGPLDLLITGAAGAACGAEVIDLVRCLRS